jgi:hypothetical protein
MRSAGSLQRQGLNDRWSGVSMSYGIDSLTNPPAVTIEVASDSCGVPVQLITEYVCEGLVIPLRSDSGTPYFSELDYLWITTLKRLQDEAHLSLGRIRELIQGRCACWKFRHCEFHNSKDCPMTSDPATPCWVNRASWHILASYPCYSCLAYRTLPYCAGIGAVLHGAASGASSAG